MTKKCKKFWSSTSPVHRACLVLSLALVLVLAFAQAQLAVATTNSAPLASATDQSVGGLDVCIIYSGASASGPDDLTLTLPGGFVARTVEFIPDMDTASNTYIWVYGMADETGIAHLNGTVAGVATFHANATNTVNIKTGTSGQVKIGAEFQVASQTYFARICR